MDRVHCNAVLGVLYNELCYKAALNKESTFSHVEKFKVGSYIGKDPPFPEGHGIYFNLLVFAV